MKINLIPITILAILLMSAWSFAQKPSFEPQSRLWVEGTSSLHDWTMTVDEFIGDLEASAAQDVKDVTVTVPVSALKSDNSKMDRKAHDALKAGSHPSITYTLDSAALAEGLQNGKFSLNTLGKLTIAGVTKPVSFSVKGEQLGDGRARYTGSTRVLMSDFNVKPPTAMLGTLKTGNEVTVHFDVIVAQ